MQFSENWLRSFVNPNLSTDALGHAMTMAGLEVEGQQPAGTVFSRVVIGEILEASKHPDADRLQVCKVNVGDEVLQIVCGAPNARAGLKAPCALVGADLPDISIKQAKVRGVESFGMMCSAKELGLAAEASGLLELPSEAPVGQDIREYFDLNDTLFTLKLTPNRADCLSILGIARDVAAMTGATLNTPSTARVDIASQRTFDVRVEAAQACPAYYGRVIEGVNAKAVTPDWMKLRLERSGIRAINAIVDVTNYVLLEFGQPMHAFDLNKLSGQINVRFAKVGETLKLLNDTEVQLKPDDLVIADAQGAVALAGIMGGESTSVANETTDIFLESAFFTQDVMAGKARRLGLSTDSSYRFERGVDFGNTLNALERATALILDICGGKVGSVTQVVGEMPARNKVTLRHARLCSVLGMDIPQATVSRLLTQLGFEADEADGSYTVQAPTYRFDIVREEDLIEEIARLYGYEHLPALAPQASLNMLPASETKRSTAWLRDVLVAHGYQEAITYSFVDASWERDLMGNQSPIALKNPIASNMSVMRSSLWGGLLNALTYNLNRKQDRVRLFELGSSYCAVSEGYVEKSKIAGVLYGDVLPEQWAEKARQADFFDAKATVDALCGNQAEYRAETHSALHPGQSAAVQIRGIRIGWLGKLHPKWQQQYGLAKNTFLFELDTEALLQAGIAQYREVPKFPAVRRDIAVIVDEHLPVQTIVETVQKAKIPLLQEIQLFDIYQGKGVSENKKSLAFLVLMQDTDKTLQDADADGLMEKLLKLLQTQFDAQLRS
ncbi:MAG TPA: phenylalanine--tRNA ligase subunit beta [Methylophilus sp.]|nr:phenylalanine--tRNA ligase subunit beta [Methylophilus sp.]HQQ33299.1 phenylalanine--tRNA ligase subunit beta [Methylophilus sp.]